MLYLRVLMFCLPFALLSAGVSAQNASIAFGAVKADPSLPVEVTADALDVNQQDGSARFVGNVIIIQGGVATLPSGLTEQLKGGGRIACLFMSGALGEVRVGHKIGGKMNWRLSFNAGAPVLNGFTKESSFQL